MRTQVFADIQSRPPNPFECLHKAFPGVGPTLAFAVNPLKQDSGCIIPIGRAQLRIVRYGVIIQMPFNAGFCPPQHLPFPQNRPAFAYPIGKPSQAQCELLATRATLYPEVSFPGLSTIVCKTQKGELLGLLAPHLRLRTCKPPKFNAARLFLGYLQAKTLQPVIEPILEVLRLSFVLKTGQKIVGETKIVRLTLALLLDPTAEPQVQHVVQVNV